MSSSSFPLRLQRIDKVKLHLLAFGELQVTADERQKHVCVVFDRTRAPQGRDLAQWRIDEDGPKRLWTRLVKRLRRARRNSTRGDSIKAVQRL